MVGKRKGVCNGHATSLLLIVCLCAIIGCYFIKCSISCIFQGIAAIPNSAFYSPEHAHIASNYIRLCFGKVCKLALYICCKIYGCFMKLSALQEDSTLQEAYRLLRQWAAEIKSGKNL